MGRNARWEYFRTIYQRYRGANRQEKQAILNEFCRNAGYHRKHAIRRLSGLCPAAGPHKRVRRRGYSYGPQALSILTEVWEVAGYPWSVRLKALLPKWMPWIRRRFRVSSEIRRQLLRISARQMDRRLRAKKSEKKRRIYGRTKPGFTEVDLVSHSGNSDDGEFAHALNVTAIHTTWTESRAVLGKGQTAVKEALNEVERALPFRLLGVDSDNGSEFINWHLKAWCEQESWTHVRKLLGWERYDSERAVEAMNDLYRHELRLWLNLFLPSVKLVRKTRVGSKLRRVHDRPQTRLERVASCPQADPQRVEELRHLERTVDPFHLGQVIERKFDHLYKWANRRWSPKLVRANAAKQTGRADGCGKAAAWKPPNRVPTPLGNPAKSGGFPLSHSHGGGRSVTSQMARQPLRKLHP